MSGATYGPPRRRKAVAGHIGPERWHQRLARLRYGPSRIPVAEPLDDAKAIALRAVATSPVTVPRAFWRQRDHALAPVILPVVLFPALLAITAIFPIHLVPRVIEMLLCTLVTAAATLLATSEMAAKGADTERKVRYWQGELDARVPGLKVHAPIERDHATTLVTTVAPGFDPDDFAHDALVSTLSGSLNDNVIVNRTGPRRVELRIEHEDLLARPAVWQPVDDLTPSRIPIGHDWDGDPVYLDLAHRSLGVFGIRGAGKSAFLNGLIAHLVAMRWVELYIVDPLEGIDLGRWWPFAKEVADTEEAGLKLIEHFNDLRASRVRSMRYQGRGVQFARWSAKWPMRVLVIDELASIMLRPAPPKVRGQDAAPGPEQLLHSIASKGRKSNDCLVVATQHPSVTVIPTLIRGQLVNVLGLKVGRREATRQVFGDDMVGDWDLSAIPGDQPGRGILQTGSCMIPVRTAGLYDAQLRRRVHELDVIRKAREAEHFAGHSDGQMSTSGAERGGEIRELASSDNTLSLGQADESPDRVNRLRDALPDDGSPMKLAQLYAALPDIPRTSLRNMLRRCAFVEKVPDRHGYYRRRAGS